MACNGGPVWVIRTTNCLSFFERRSRPCLAPACTMVILTLWTSYLVKKTWRVQWRYVKTHSNTFEAHVIPWTSLMFSDPLKDWTFLNSTWMNDRLTLNHLNVACFRLLSFKALHDAAGRRVQSYKDREPFRGHFRRRVASHEMRLSWHRHDRHDIDSSDRNGFHTKRQRSNHQVSEHQFSSSFLHLAA